MDLFNIVVGCATILSFFISIFVASSVIKIKNSINIGDTNKIKNSIKNNEMKDSTINQGANNYGDRR